tara:strand:+ start:6353 stop:6595 length:243 start_codon:yes stop_codon:yes gene_type:complete
MNKIDKIENSIEVFNDNLMNQLYEMVENREKFWDERSEKWQYSEKGQDYQNITNELDLIRDDIDGLFDDIKNELLRIKRL